jgi:hypothetical protein
VRLVVVPTYTPGQTPAWSVSVAKSYTYTPFGKFYDGQCVENIDNPFKFTGQWAACPERRRGKAEIDQYYVRARMYDDNVQYFSDAPDNWHE